MNYVGATHFAGTDHLSVRCTYHAKQIICHCETVFFRRSNLPMSRDCFASLAVTIYPKG